jgi:hypothetical protein
MLVVKPTKPGQNDKRAVEIVDQQISAGLRLDKKQR